MIHAAVKLARRYSHVNWALADQAIVSGVNFLTNILVARFLGIREFGVFTLAWMGVLFVNSIQMAVVSTPMMTIGPKHEGDDKSKYYGAVVLQQIGFSSLATVILWISVHFSYLVDPSLNVSHLAEPLAAALFWVQNQDFFRRLFFSRDERVAAFSCDVVTYIGRILFLILIYFYGWLDITIDIVLWVIAACAAIGVLFSISRISDLKFKRTWFLRVFQRHWSMAKWMVASAVMQWTSGNYFMVVAGWLLGTTSVGALRAAQNIAGVNHILIHGLDNIVSPHAAKKYVGTGYLGLADYLVKVSIFGTGAMLIIALALGGWAEFWMEFIYNNSYAEYYKLLQLYCVVYVMFYFGLPLRSGLRALEYTGPIFVSYLLATLLSLASAHFLIKNFGEYGVLIGVLLTQVTMQLTLFVALKNRLRQNISR